MIYIVLLEDRHIDPDLFAFATRERAIAKAEELLAEFAWEGAEIERGQSEDPSWLWHARYSEEGGSVRVLRRELL